MLSRVERLLRDCEDLIVRGPIWCPGHVFVVTPRFIFTDVSLIRKVAIN
jgi:hypothetical protein